MVYAAPMLPEFEIGPLTVQTFGLMFALAFVAAGLLVRKRLIELGKPGDWAYELILSGLVGGIVGARLYYLIQNWSVVQDDLFGNIVSGAGLVWYGGLIGGALAVIAWAKYRRLLNVALLDLVAPALALGYAVGRIGCQLSGDGDYGTHSDLPWAMSYPDGTVPTTDQVHPTPIYEFLAMSGVAYLLWRLRGRLKDGALFALYLVLSGLERLLVEFIRRNDEVFVGLTFAQLESIGLIAAGSIWLYLIKRSAGRVAAGAAPKA